MCEFLGLRLGDDPDHNFLKKLLLAQFELC